MNIKLIFLILINTSVVYCSFNAKIDKIYTKLAVEYFTTRKIQNVVMFYCSPPQRKVEVIKKFWEANIAVSFPDGSHKKSKKRIDDLYRMPTNKLGSIFDGYCFRKSTPFTNLYTLFFNSTYAWLVFDSGLFEASLNYTKTLPLSITTDMLITKTIPKDHTYEIQIYDVFNPGKDRGGELNATYLCTYSENTEMSNLENKLSPSLFSQRYDLHGLEIRVASYSDFIKPNQDLHEYLTSDFQPYVDSSFKLNYHLVLILKDMYNFTIALIKANNWSDRNAMGLYQSENMVGLLANKKADIMGGALRIGEDNLNITDILHLTYPFRSGFIFRYSGEFGRLKITFLAPFEAIIWYIFIIINIILIFVIFLVMYVEFKHLPFENVGSWTFGDVILTVWGAWCQMGSTVSPQASAGRVVFFTLFLNSLVMYNFYTSSIVSSLLNFGSKDFTLRELADSPIKCGSEDTGYAKAQIFNKGNRFFDYFNKRKVTKDFYTDKKLGLALVKEGSFAYHAEYNSIYEEIDDTFTAAEICELQEVDTVPLSNLAIMGVKHSPYSEMFRVGLAKTREMGYLSRSLQKWVAEKPSCQANKGVDHVNLHQILSFFMVLSIGTVISIIVFLYEIFWSDRRCAIPNKQRRVNKNKRVKRGPKPSNKWGDNFQFVKKYSIEQANSYKQTLRKYYETKQT